MSKKEFPESAIDHSVETDREKKSHNSYLKELIEWGLKEERIELSLEKEGYKTILSQENRTLHGKTSSSSIKILERKGSFILMIDGKVVHKADSLESCYRFGEKKGYRFMLENENHDKKDQIRKFLASEKTASKDKPIKKDPSWSISSMGHWFK